MLRLLPAYKDATLIRSRELSQLSRCDIVVDVGGEYKPSNHRYDHHQRWFNTSFPDRSTKLSSAGLVWLHFGRDIIAAETGLSEDAPEVKILWTKMYLDFIEAIDANDNGISVHDPAKLEAAGIEKRFSNGGNNISAAVGDFNLEWNDPALSDPAEAKRKEDAQFQEARSFIGTIFQRKLAYYATSWLPARSFVQAAFKDRRKYDARGRIMLLDRSVPWKAHLYSLEAEAAKGNNDDDAAPPPETTARAAERAGAGAGAEKEKGEGEGESQGVLYVLYPESLSADTKWRIQAVPVGEGSFESRKALPDAWRGLRDKQLGDVAGVPDSVFVHASGFIGGHRSREGVLSMAKKALG